MAFRVILGEGDDDGLVRFKPIAGLANLAAGSDQIGTSAMPRFPGNPPSRAFNHRLLMEFDRKLALADRQHQIVLRRVRRSVEAARGVIARRRDAGEAR
jgi:hypothetical protein